MSDNDPLPEGLPAVFTELENSFVSSINLAGSGAKQFYEGVSPSMSDEEAGNPLARLYDTAAGFGKAALGAAGVAYSPVDASVRSLIGNPIENATNVPSGLTSFLAEAAFPLGWSKAGGALEGLNDFSKMNKFDAGLGIASSEARKPTPQGEPR